MEIYDITVNGSGFDKKSNFNNYALTLVVKDDEAEKTVRANLRYYPRENEWYLNPIFHEFTEAEKQVMIDQIIHNDTFRSVFETIDISLKV
ncbi:hypothetical protein JT05_13470 [Desulfosporosinus sp. Tol-M]|nr:hypothetical protein JT05_13470 [Desulfosporosinus sp. Tol-M]